MRDFNNETPFPYMIPRSLGLGSAENLPIMRLHHAVLCLAASAPGSRAAIIPLGAAAAHAAASIAHFASLHAAGLPAIAVGAKTAAAHAATAHATSSVTAAAHAGAVTTGHSTLAGAATHASLTGAAATGAVNGARIVSPEEITARMRRNDNTPNVRAVGRILQIEWRRLKEAASRGVQAPGEVAQRLTERGPIVTWALDLWLRGKLGIQEASSNIPDIVASLRVLEIELASQVKLGFASAPLRAIKLLMSATMLTVLALMARIPLFDTLRKRVQATWPKTVDHLAAVLEQNLADDPTKGVFTSGRARRIGERWRRVFPLAASSAPPP